MSTSNSDDKQPVSDHSGEEPSGTDDSELARHLAKFTDQRAGWHQEDANSEHALPSDILGEIDVIQEIEDLVLHSGPPPNLGPYKLIRLLDHGGMGDVFLAWQNVLGRTVALKVLKHNLLKDKNARKRFEREARVAAGLHHPNIVPVYDLGVDAGWPFYAMELVEGETLRQIQMRVQQSDDGTPVALAPGEVQERTQTTMWLLASSSDALRGNTPGSGIPVLPAAPSGEARGLQGDTSVDTSLTRKGAKDKTPSEALALPIADRGVDPDSRSSGDSTQGNGKSSFYKWLALAMAGAADGLNYAHNHKVLHRDIKPSNLMLDENGCLRILDFGLAWVEDDMELTGSGRFVGTIPFMSPEQAQGGHQNLSRGSDIYSLGATVYSVLSGRPVFQGSSYKETLHQIGHDDPVPLRTVNGHVPRDVETIVMKCLRKSPRDRYLTAEALAQDLRRYAKGEPIEARPVPPWLRALDRLWRQRAKILQAAAALVLLVAAVFLIAGYLARVKQDRYRNLEADISRAALMRTRPSSASTGLAPGYASYSSVVPDKVLMMSRYEPHNSSTFLPVFLPVGPLLPEVESSRVQLAVSLLKDTVGGNESPQGYCALAVGYVALGRYDDAGDAAERALQLDPDLKEALAVQRLVESHGVDVHSPRRPESLTRETEEWIETWTRAHTASLAGDWEVAAAAFSALLGMTPSSEKKRPGYLRDLLSTAVALFEAGRTLEALGYLGEVRSLWQEFEKVPVDVTLLKGWFLLRAHPEVAREVGVFETLYLELAEDTARRDAVVLRVAGLYRKFRDYKAARSWLEKIQLPTAGSLRLEAELLLSQGEPSSALEAARRALAMEEAPGEVETRIVLGNVFLVLAREEKSKAKKDKLVHEARQAYEAAIERAPKDPRGHVARGLLREFVDDLEGAASDFQKALEQAAHCASAWFHLGRLREKEGNLDDAVGHYRQALRWSHNNALAATHLGSLLARQDQTIEAIQWLTRARNADPELPQARYNLALVYLQVNRYDDAVEEFRKAIRLGLDSDVVHHNLGTTLQSLCRYFDAMQQYKPLVDKLLEEYRSGKKTVDELRQDKDFMAALLNRANGMYKEYKAGVAIPLYREVLEFWPENPDVHVYLGLALWETEAADNQAEAIRELREAVRLRPEDGLVRSYLAARIQASGIPEGPELADLIRQLESGLGTSGLTVHATEVLDECRQKHRPALASLASVDWLLATPEVILGDDADWQYFRGTTEPSKALAWTQAGFQPEPDKPWQTGKGPFGYDTKGQAKLRTDLEEMQGKYTTLYLRHEFSVSRKDEYEGLVLTGRYDDGFVAYLNGEEIGRKNISCKDKPVPFDEKADTPFNGSARIKVPREFVQPGENVLAIQVFNIDSNSSDLLLSARLAVTWAPDAARDGELIEQLEKQDSGKGAAARLSYLKGRVLQRLGDTERAIAELQKARDATPERAEPLLRVAKCRRDLGDIQGALEVVRTGILERRQPEKPLWDLWLQLVFPGPDNSLEEALAAFPGQPGLPPDGRGADLRWVLEQLRDHGAVRINCGGEAYRGPDGRYWGEDRFYAGGSRYSGYLSAPSEIYGTEDDPLYQTERNVDLYTRLTEDHLYSVPLPPGVYTVTLHFAEIWYGGEGQRMFDVSLEGESTLAGHDPLATSGGRATADVEVLSGINVKGGSLEILLEPINGQPQISAIEIERQPRREP